MSERKIPRRVENCTTHHAACACREWRHVQMETTLKVIQTWAACDRYDSRSREAAMLHIENMCKKALNCLKQEDRHE